VEFLARLSAWIIILKITLFASIMIVGFDLATTEVNDIVVGVMHVGFFMKQLCG
jgi:hypothetical protein